MGIIRKTKHFQKVLDEFSKSARAISANSLVSRFASLMNKSTIYRILNKLEDDNIIHSFIGLNGLKWYAKCSDCSSQKHNDNHPHFQCEACNEVRCIPNVTNEPELIGSQFHVKNILISGLCSRCFSV
ncbi:MAG: transcriptional regulator [Euryarchaeota archaeon]|nr:transcriptional regulator [Euryarchaeota archaeon]|tara:strand:+ start:598 stop:981 length:384 start_codon:yes stop_codon:yes gene_type:complete